MTEEIEKTDIAHGDNPLGKVTDYPTQYAPHLLFPIDRQENRQQLGLSAATLPFEGYDLWRAYELSWLDQQGKPVVALGEFSVPCRSRNLIESKSMKLYLNSLNQERFQGPDQVRERIAEDLSERAAAPITVKLLDLQQADALTAAPQHSAQLDHLEISVEHFTPAAELLKADRQLSIQESVHSHLFRSNCPITAQPDWGSVFISYSGAAIDHAALLQYIVSYRQHEGFHESCVEQMFVDIMRACQPEWLAVGINFLRRGGLEINPYRWTENAPITVPRIRSTRQ